jgi:heat shock protein HtpX
LGVTDGLLGLLGTRELTGVLAHEISHLRNGDTRIMMLSDVVGRFVQLLSYVGLWSMALTVPMSVAAQEPVLVLVSALLLVVPMLVTLLQLALSRSRELDADLDGATLTGDLEGLARGLLLLERAGGRGWESALVRRTGTPHPLLRSHPPTAVRVQRLRQLVDDQRIALHEPSGR